MKCALILSFVTVPAVKARLRWSDGLTRLREKQLNKAGYKLRCSFNKLDLLSEEEANDTLKYVMSKYEEVEMKITGEPVSIYGLRLLYGDIEEELNIHFKYIDNTQQDIIQNCVFALYHRQNECELIKTVCNTFLPFTPRPLMERKDLRICDGGSDVLLVEKEDFYDEETTMMTTTDILQIVDGSKGDIPDDEVGGVQARHHKADIEKKRNINIT